MTSPARIIYQLLADLGQADMHVAFLPDQPDEAACVYDTAGRPDGRIMATGERIDHPGIQVRVRGKDYHTTWNRANTIALALDAAMRTVVDIASDEVYRVHNVSRVGTIIPLGVEETGDRRRFHFTINAVVTISEIIAEPETFYRLTEAGDIRITEAGDTRIIE